MDAALQVLATLCAALFAGAALYISIVEHPARLKTGVPTATEGFRHMYKRAAPWQASLAIVSLLAGLAVAFSTRNWLWALGGIAVGAVIPYTLTVMMPTNRLLLGGPLLTEAEALALLKRWGALHWVRSIVSTFGLLVLLCALVCRTR
jgi:anthrone oxygenase-like protein